MPIMAISDGLDDQSVAREWVSSRGSLTTVDSFTGLDATLGLFLD